MMKVTYFALRPFDGYHEGDLIPNAGEWPFVSGYITQGKVAPVLVASLPEHLQDALAAWEDERDANVTEVASFLGERPEPEAGEDDDAEEGEEGEVTYDDLTVADLKAELDARNIEHPSTLLKADLIDLLVADDDADGDDTDDTTGDDE